MNLKKLNKYGARLSLGIFLFYLLIFFGVGNFTWPNQVPDNVIMNRDTQWSILTPFICRVEQVEGTYGAYCNILQVIFDPWHLIFSFILTLITIVLIVVPLLAIILIINLIKKSQKN